MKKEKKLVFMFFVLPVKSWNLLVFKDLFTEHLLLPVGSFWLPGTHKEVKTREGLYHVQETHTNEITALGRKAVLGALC